MLLCRSPLLLVPLLHLAAAAAPPRAVLFVRHPAAARARVYEELARRSDPGTDVFLSWLDGDSVARMLTPSRADLAAAVALAERHGATSHALHGGDKLEVVFGGAGEVPPAFVREMHGMEAIDMAAHTRRTAVVDEEKMPARSPLRRTKSNTTMATAGLSGKAGIGFSNLTW